MKHKLRVPRVDSCPTCRLAPQGHEWSPVCEAWVPARALPRDHDPDGPPPAWCPLPITIHRAGDEGGDRG